MRTTIVDRTMRCWLGLSVACLASLTARAEDDRAQVPTPFDQETGTKVVRELFAADYQKEQPEARRTLARKLLAKAGEERAKTLSRFVLLSETCDLSVKGGDTSMALRAVDELEQEFQIDSIEMRRVVLLAASTSKLTLVRKEFLASAWVELLERAVQLDDYKRGRLLAGEASAVAKKLRDSAITKSVKKATSRVERLAAAFQKLEPQFQKLLVESRDDPDANLAIGKFYADEKGDLSGGIPFLAKSPASPLQAAAVTDQAAQRAEATEVEAGDAWYRLAQSAKEKQKAVYASRATLWYRRSLVSLEGLEKTRVEQRLAELRGAGGVELAPVKVEELATLCFQRTKRGWTVSDLDKFAVARKSGVLVVRNAQPVLQFAYLIRRAPLAGDFVAEIDVRGAIGVGLASARSRSRVYQVEAPLKNAASRVRIERRAGELRFWVNKREVEPQGSRRASFSRGGLLFVRIGKNKTCYIRRLSLYAEEGDSSFSSRVERKRRKDRRREREPRR